MGLAEWIRTLLSHGAPPEPGGRRRSDDDERPSDVTATIDLIVGLGNPGAEHADDRHNAGYRFVDELARRHEGRFSANTRFHGDVARIDLGRHDLRLLKPTTYMNRSGQSVRALAAFYKIPPERILVVHDDIDLQPGDVRLKKGGGHGGNNGLRDVIAQLGATFARLRIGVGHPGHRDDVVDYVLRRARPDEDEAIGKAIDKGIGVLPMLLGQGFERAMHKLHTKKKSKANPRDAAAKPADETP